MESKRNFKEIIADVEALIFDVDGVLSRETISMYPSGEPMARLSLLRVATLSVATTQKMVMPSLTQ